MTEMQKAKQITLINYLMIKLLKLKECGEIAQHGPIELKLYTSHQMAMKF